jgi:cytoskeletal protein CcmA (bactofilin family)
MGQSNTTIGQSVIIRGELSARENLNINGQVDGKIELNDHVLTIGLNRKIATNLLAKAAAVVDKVHGKLKATKTINIRETVTINGALVSPRVGITKGSSFRSQIDIQQPQV